MGTLSQLSLHDVCDVRTRRGMNVSELTNIQKSSLSIRRCVHVLTARPYYLDTDDAFHLSVSESYVDYVGWCGCANESPRVDPGSSPPSLEFAEMAPVIAGPSLSDRVGRIMLNFSPIMLFYYA